LSYIIFVAHEGICSSSEMLECAQDTPTSFKGSIFYTFTVGVSCRLAYNAPFGYFRSFLGQEGTK